MRVPRAVLVERREEHLVQAQGVRAVAVDDRVRRDAVLQALAHLAVAARHRSPVVDVLVAAALDLGGLDVDAALVGVRGGLHIALVEQTGKRLAGADVPQVVEDLVPEARVEQVENGVLDAADVQVDAAGAHPVALHLRGDERVRILRIQVAQVVPARPGPLGHRVRLAPVARRPASPGRARRRPSRWRAPAAAPARSARRGRARARSRRGPATGPGARSPAARRAGRCRRRRSGSAHPSSAGG